MPASPWPIIHAERSALAADLASLPDAAWATPSLCQGWTVQQVLGHMTQTASMTPVSFLTHFARAGFRFNVMIEKDAAARASGAPRDTLAQFTSYIGATMAPPGPVDSWLGETIVHSTDIRWPLNIKHTFSAPVLIRVADFYKRSNVLIGAKRRIQGITLTASDANWSTGTGPEVTGPLLAIVMAMTGRTAALAQLTGPGAQILASQL